MVCHAAPGPPILTSRMSSLQVSTGDANINDIAPMSIPTLTQSPRPPVTFRLVSSHLVSSPAPDPLLGGEYHHRGGDHPRPAQNLAQALCYMVKKRCALLGGKFIDRGISSPPSSPLPGTAMGELQDYPRPGWTRYTGFQRPWWLAVRACAGAR